MRATTTSSRSGDVLAVSDGDQCGFSNGTPPFGNGSGINPLGTPGCPTEAYQLNLIQDDFIHATTLGSGLIANDVLFALGSNYGFDVPLLSGQEIVDAALAIPEPGAAVLFLGAFFLIAAYRAHGSRTRR